MHWGGVDVIRVAALAAALATAACVATDPGPGRHPQLAATVQQRLDVLGFRSVDARTLSLGQLAALHLQLQGRAMDFGAGRFAARQKVLAILAWD